MAVATALTAPLGFFEALVIPYASSFATALTVLFVAAWTLGDMAGRAVFARGWSGAWTGWFLALTCLAMAVCAGSLVTLLGEGWPEAHAWGEAIYDYVYKPLFWVGLMALLPSAWLAWLFAKLLARDGAPCNPARHDTLIRKQALLILVVAIGGIIGLCFIPS